MARTIERETTTQEGGLQHYQSALEIPAFYKAKKSGAEETDEVDYVLFRSYPQKKVLEALDELTNTHKIDAVIGEPFYLRESIMTRTNEETIEIALQSIYISPADKTRLARTHTPARISAKQQ